MAVFTRYSLVTSAVLQVYTLHCLCAFMGRGLFGRGRPFADSVLTFIPTLHYYIQQGRRESPGGPSTQIKEGWATLL